MNKKCFIVKKGGAIDVAATIVKRKQEARDFYREVIKEVGAEDGYYHRHGVLCGFTFKNEPDSRFKKVKGGGYMPKLNTAWGKRTTARLDAVAVRDEEVLSYFDISEELFDMPYIKQAVVMILPYDEPVILIKLPWASISPTEIKEHRDGVASDCKIAYVTQVLDAQDKYPELVEVEGYVIKEEIDKFNQSLKGNVGS